jgi:hypothetical protein
MAVVSSILDAANPLGGFTEEMEAAWVTAGDGVSTLFSWRLLLLPPPRLLLLLPPPLATTVAAATITTATAAIPPRRLPLLLLVLQPVRLPLPHYVPLHHRFSYCHS